MNKVFRNGEKHAKGLKNYRYFWNSLITIIGFEIWEARFFFTQKIWTKKGKRLKFLFFFKKLQRRSCRCPT